jgi:hypothetical protein
MTLWNNETKVFKNIFVDDCLAKYSYNDCNGCISDLSYFISENNNIVNNTKELNGCGCENSIKLL